MLNILDTKLLLFISKNRLTFVLVVLLVGNIYQYLQRNQAVTESNAQIKELNQKIQDRDKQSIEYERQRSEKLELLLHALSKGQ